MDRKKKLRLIQIGLLILGLLIIFFTYSLKRQDFNESIISKETQKQIKENIAQNKDEGDIFYDIIYNGIDLSGNRYESVLNMVDMGGEDEYLPPTIVEA